MGEIEVSVVLPCRNERETIGICIKKIKEIFKNNCINGEIIVSDSSNDGSDKIAKILGAMVIKHDKKGYGNAYLEVFKYINGKYIIIGDADNTYDFLEIPKFLDSLNQGYDFVIGSRLRGEILPGSMKWLHQYVGNPMLNAIFNLLFKTSLSDTHCGFRAFRKEVLDKLNLKHTGMEFALEMLTKVVKNNFRIKEIPITYYPREGISKLNSFRDGFRHLGFMLWNKIK